MKMLLVVFGEKIHLGQSDLFSLSDKLSQVTVNWILKQSAHNLFLDYYWILKQSEHDWYF